MMRGLSRRRCTVVSAAFTVGVLLLLAFYTGLATSWQILSTLAFVDLWPLFLRHERLDTDFLFIFLSRFLPVPSSFIQYIKQTAYDIFLSGVDYDSGSIEFWPAMSEASNAFSSPHRKLLHRGWFQISLSLSLSVVINSLFGSPIG